MKSTQYLYGIEAYEFQHMPYVEAIEYKKQHAKELSKKLHEEMEQFYKDGGTYDDAAALRLRCSKVSNAFFHCNKLLAELYERE